MKTGTSTARPILLAPAGSRAAVSALLAAGADALYAGEKGWSRGGRGAGMAPDEIREAAAHCRSVGASLAVALNTVPGASEVPSFLATVRRLAGEGVSGVILSDPGMIRRVRAECPGLPITASVGLSTVNPSDARFYRELGADAIVLPTAIAPEEIPAIKAESGLRIEVFVRCRPEILLQGQCALSGYAREASPAPERPGAAAAGNPASAKRSGRCFLACRSLPLAAAEHSIEEDLPRWIACGADIFKVEGRELPLPRILDIVTRARRKLDRAIAAAGEHPV
jgi:U32 family peptidase